MARWLAFPYDTAAYTCDLATLRSRWAALHVGDAEPLPASDEVLSVWALYHAGRFEEATHAGLDAGVDGLTAANAAQLVYAHYLETDERAKRALLLDVVERAEAQAAARPGLASARYQAGYCLGRYAQGIPIVAALAQGLVARVKSALEEAISLEPRHADAHFALGAFHADVIDKLGDLRGRRQGASGQAGVTMFETALRLHPASIAGRLGYANGLLMLHGARRMAQATALWQSAAAGAPRDARERLDVEIAKIALRD